MTVYICGTHNKKPKRCLHCKHYWMWGIGGGSCLRFNRSTDYKSTNHHCKYYKRNSRVFDKNGKIKNQELYNEMLM